MKYFRNFLTLNIVFVLILGTVSILSAQQNQRLQFANSLEMTGNYEGALKIYMQEFQRGNESHQVITGIRKCFSKLQKYEEMIRFYEKLLERYPNRLNYKIDLGHAYFQNNQEGKAMSAWQSVYQAQPENATAYRLVAMAMVELRLFDEAIAVFRLAVKNVNNPEMLYRDIAMLYKIQLNYEQAVNYYLKYYLSYKKQLSYIRSQIISMTKDDEALARVIGSIQAFLDASGKTEPELEELLAGLYIKRRNFDRAFRIYKRIHTENSDKNYLMRFAREAEANGAFVYAINTYRLLLESTSETDIRQKLEHEIAGNLYRQGFSLADSGQNDAAQMQVNDAVEILERLIRQNKVRPVVQRSIELLGDIHKNFYNDLDRAIQLFDRLTRPEFGKKGNDPVFMKLADCYVLKNDLPTAVRYYQKVNNKRFKDLGRFHLAEIKYYQGQFSAAKAMYHAVLSHLKMSDSLSNNCLGRIYTIDQFASDSATFARFANAELLQRRNKASEAAEKFIEVYDTGKPISPHAALRAVRLFRKLGRLDRAAEISASLVESHPDFEQIDQVYFTLAQINLKQENHHQALAYFRKIILDYPTSFYLDKARIQARALSSKIEETELP